MTLKIWESWGDGSISLLVLPGYPGPEEGSHPPAIAF